MRFGRRVGKLDRASGFGRQRLSQVECQLSVMSGHGIALPNVRFAPKADITEARRHVC